jgi:hypothetical protein
MRARLLIIVTLALWAWVLPVAHTMPIDANGPSGLSDNEDFDDLLLSLTSPTAAAVPTLMVIPNRSIAINAVVLLGTGPVRSVVRSSVAIRAPPLA